MSDIQSAETPYVTLAEGTIASDYVLKNLNKSLGEAQSEFLRSAKTEENRWGGYKYSSLEGIINAVRPSLTKHHLTVSQFPVVDLELKIITMVTRLVHWDSGEWIQHSLPLPAELALGKDGAPKFNQQTIGGSSTYAQKYAYKTIVGIPDSEELIDSSEEKGDLPARAKTPSGSAPQPVVQNVQTSVRSQFFTRAKEYGWGLQHIKAFLSLRYPQAKGSTASLNEEQIAETLTFMSQHKPEDVLSDANA